MKRLILNPEWFRFLDHMPAPRMPRWRKRGRHNADALFQPLPSTGQRHAPRHAATSPRITLVTEKTTKPPRQPNSPFDTAEMPVLTDEETLRLYERGERIKRGDWGTMPAERVIAGEQRAKGLIA